MWYENTDGLGSFASEKPIMRGYSRSIHAADVDGDGDLDALSVGGGWDITWCQNSDGKGHFGGRPFTWAEGAGLHAADLDRDGDVDVLSSNGTYGGIAWFENADGRGDLVAAPECPGQDRDEARSRLPVRVDVHPRQDRFRPGLGKAGEVWRLP